MNTHIKNLLFWNYSLAHKFIRDVPGSTLTIVGASLASQISLMLTFFLPLKVLILLGSPELPAYFPKAWLESELNTSLSRDTIIVSLSILAVIFYLSHLILEWTINQCSSWASRHLLRKTKKIALFENQEIIAARAYKRFSHSLAGLVIIILVIAGLSIFYSVLAIFFIGYLAAALTSALILASLNTRFRAKIRSNDLGSIASTLSATGFLLSFLFVVIDFLSGSNAAILTAIISLLFLRQALQRFATLIQDISILHNQRNNINALFFHEKVLAPTNSNTAKDFFLLLEEPRRSEWISKVLVDVTGIENKITEIKWHQTSLPDIVAFEITARASNAELPKQYLIKLFNTSRSTLALHEANLFLHCLSEQLPALAFLSSNKVGNLLCNVFTWKDDTKLPKREVWLKQPVIAGKLMTLEPPRALVEQYLRSRPPLWQRLNKEMFNHLRRVASSDSDLAIINSLNKSFDKIIATLKALPLQITNLELSPDTLLQSTEGELLLSHWGRWSLEPVGASYPASNTDLERLSEFLERSKQLRPSLSNVTIEQVNLAALMFDFERTYIQQQYFSTLLLLPLILNCLPLQNFNEV